MSDNMSGPEIINLENLYLFDGGTKDNWDFFCKDINNESYCQKIMFSLFNYLTTQPKNELTLDIIDYIIDYGCPKILNMCSTKSFLDQILNLLKPETNAGLENQKKAIFLIQRWSKKFSNDKNMIIFQEQYNMLKNNGITFPPENFIIKTYDKFTGQRKDNINNTNNTNNNNNQKEIKKEEQNKNIKEQKDEFPPAQEEQTNDFDNNENNSNKINKNEDNSINKFDKNDDIPEQGDKIEIKDIKVDLNENKNEKDEKKVENNDKNNNFDNKNNPNIPNDMNNNNNLEKQNLEIKPNNELAQSNKENESGKLRSTYHGDEHLNNFI